MSPGPQPRVFSKAFLKSALVRVDVKLVKRRISSRQFCLYLWRSENAPGVRYLANSVDAACAVYREMSSEGYIVKAIEVSTGCEYETRDGSFVPVHTPLGSSGSPIPAMV